MNTNAELETLGRALSRDAMDLLLGTQYASRRNAENQIVELQNEIARMEAEQETIRSMKDKLWKAERRIEDLLVPLCIGKTMLSMLKQEGAWVSENGRGLVAADDLFREPETSVYDALLAHTNSVRSQSPGMTLTTYITRAARDVLAEEGQKKGFSTHFRKEVQPCPKEFFAGAELRITKGGGIHFVTLATGMSDYADEFGDRAPAH